MKAKIVILTVLLAVMLLWLFQSASAQDNETTENTEKTKELNQQEKQSPLARIWNYISNNALLAGVIAIVVVALGTWVIQRLRRRQERQKPSLPVGEPPLQPLPRGLTEIAREALEKGRGLTIETEKAKMTISPAIDGISELMPKETPVRQHIEDGDRFFHKDEFKESAASYDKAGKTARDLKDEKSSALASLGKGATLCRQGKYNEAIAILTECTKYLEGEALARAYYNRGVAYGELGKTDKQVEDYTKAIEIDPQFAMAYNNRGNAYRGLKDYKKAFEDYDKAIEIAPQFAAAYNNRGVAYADLKEYKKAIEDYDKAIEIAPQDAAPYYNLACVCALRKQEGDKERMINYLKKAIELDDECKKNAKEDEDLKDYWDDPEFKELVE